MSLSSFVGPDLNLETPNSPGPADTREASSSDISVLNG